MYDKLTTNDVKRMKEEIEHRKIVVRKAALEAVKEARAHGDLSENFEYYAAKKDKNANESRIRYLERMIKTAVIAESAAKDDEVGLDKTVEIQYDDTKKTEKYKLVTSVRGNILKGLITIESPLAKAIMGHKTGELVHVKVSESVGYDVIIKSIENTTDDGTDEIRRY